MQNVEDNAPSARRILLASLAALALALVLLVTLVMPAEFNLDPLGTGQLLGISGMSEEQTVGAINLRQEAYNRDQYRIVLAPFESVEYKYRLEEGAAMLFTWKADHGELLFDMHSEQDGVDPQEYSPSFAAGSATESAGSFTAPFSGIHGWFWENRGSQDVVLVLQATGFFSAATEFRQGFEYKKNLSDPANGGPDAP